MKTNSPHSEHSGEHGAFPTATLVVGVGEMGQQILVQLAERWSWLKRDSADDPTLQNLRLLQLNPEVSERWTNAEVYEGMLADREGDSREPEFVFNFLILRTLGLIRYHDGVWQIARPEDRGPITLLPNGDPASGDAKKGNGAVNNDATLTPEGWRDVVETMRKFVDIPDEIEALLNSERRPNDSIVANGLFADHSTFRLRCYRWLSLSEDPRDAAQRLDSAFRSDGELARFVEPILARVRDGNAPLILLHALRRYLLWTRGQDPSPWLDSHPSETESAVPSTGSTKHTDRLRRLTRAYDKAIFGENVCADDTKDDDDPIASVLTPDYFRQGRTKELTTPLSPWALLSLNWETPGWTFNSTSSENRIFRALPGSRAAFGFRDTDQRLQVNDKLRLDANAWYVHLGSRIEGISKDAQRGFIRLWSHLTRLRRAETDDTGDGFYDAHLAALQHSLEILGEFVIREVLQDETHREDIQQLIIGNTPASSNLSRVAAWQREFNELITPEQSDLDRRLRALGVPLPQKAVAPSPLLAEHSIHLRNDGSASGHFNIGEHDLDDATVRHIRHWVNRNARDLLSTHQLSRLPRPPGQMPLYFRVFIVGDLGESATRIASLPLVRYIHAELLRVITPIYEGRFDGHTRPLTITPIFSMPHPADAAGAEHIGTASPEANADGQLSAFESKRRRIHERLVIDSVHAMRRWIELIPPAERLTFEMLINGRVTDRSVLSTDDAVEEIRSFIWMNARNALSDIPDINRILNNRSDDVLATFSCRELAFPGERARTWVSNRYARALLHSFRTPHSETSPSGSRSAHAPGAENREIDKWLLEKSDASRSKDSQANKIEKIWDEFAEKTGIGIKEKIEIRAEHNAEDILHDLVNEAKFREFITDPIHQEWQRVASEDGPVDRCFSDVNKTVSTVATSLLRHPYENSNKVVSDTLKHKGSAAAREQIDHINRALDNSRKAYRDERENAEARVLENHQPDPGRFTKAPWEDLILAIQKKPDKTPLYFGAVSFALAFATIGGPLFLLAIQPISFLQSHTSARDPDWFSEHMLELVVFAGMIALFVCLAKRWMTKHLNDIKQKKEALITATHQAISGSEKPLAILPFFTSRMEHRWRSLVDAHATELSVIVRDEHRLVQRIDKAAEIRMDTLRDEIAHAGVRARLEDNAHVTSSHESMKYDVDDIEMLFDNHYREEHWLISPSTLVQWYEANTRDNPPTRAVDKAVVRNVEQDTLLRNRLHQFFEEHPIGDAWRTQLPFSDDALARFARNQETPPWKYLSGGAVLQDEILQNAAVQVIRDFTANHFGALGFGAKFRGYESLDEDGINNVELTLLMGKELAHSLERLVDDSATTSTKDVVRREGRGQSTEHQKNGVVRRVPSQHLEFQTNSAYLLMTALGIRERSFQNLRRFTTFHDRRQLPTSEHFPFSLSGATTPANSNDAPMHYFSHQRIDGDRPAPVNRGGKA